MKRIPLDDRWKFYAEAVEEAPFMKTSRKNQDAEAYASRFFNAIAWQDVTLPHDWAIALPYDETASNRHGHRAVTSVDMDGQTPGEAHYRRVPSVGWYRRVFHVPAEWLGQRVYVEFDGIYRDSRVWINGQFVDRHESGYIGFRYDLTDNLYYGEENTIAVAADAREIEGWWYEGAGIYRHARLITCDTLHLDPKEITVRADMDGTFAFSLTAFNDSDEGRAARICCTLKDGDKTVFSEEKPLHLDGWTQSGFSFEGQLSSPRLWSPDEPNLYSLSLSLMGEDGSLIDGETLNVGFRSFRFDADNGLFVNEQPLKIRGACMHQDFAGVGVALPDGLHEYKIRRLKEMGVNAYRSSHHAPAPEIVDACDRLGMLLMDETRMFGSTPSAMRELEALIRRDRTHPCVLIWSLGNEEHNVQDTPVGARLARSMVRLVRSLDSTRPITYSGNNGGNDEGINPVVDVRGINYIHMRREAFADEYHAQHPEQPIIGSEETSIVMARGEYREGREAYPTAYGEIAMPWGSTAEGWWKYYSERPFLAGGFMWTGFDYNGEPSPYARNSSTCFGVIDLCGYAKDPYYYYEAWWTKKDVLHLFPHWNWREGEIVRVMVFSNMEQVELLLNGRSLGTLDMEKYGHLEWNVPFEVGTLEAVGYRGGREILRTQRTTAKKAARIELTAEQSAPNSDVYLIHALLTDENGLTAPMAHNALDFSCDDGCTPLGVGNGDPASKEDQQFLPGTQKYELLDWRKTENGVTTPWNAFQQRSNEHYIDHTVPQKLERIENYAPFRDPVRIVARSLNAHYSARFETDFYAEESDILTCTRLYFERLEGEYAVRLNGETVGHGNAKGYPCAFEITRRPGENHIEVDCSDAYEAGGIYRGVYLTRKTEARWTRSAYNGRALLVVRKTASTASVTVCGKNLDKAHITF